MYQAAQHKEELNTLWRVSHEELELHTAGGGQFIDVTESIAELVAASGVLAGWVNIQTRHTTTAIIVNEHEPLLLEDLRQTLERLAPQEQSYRHDDFSVRTVNLEPDEPPNGHAHCKALFLRASETINVVNGRLQLGRWQRIFFVELDSARTRRISVMVMGQAGARLRVVRGGQGAA
jgi:secondary thiamine-phosphate synthase enzyme